MKDSTKAVILGRDPHANHGVVNLPVHHASTILFPTVEDLAACRHIPPGDGVVYGVHGTPTTFGLEEAICGMEGGYRTRLQPSGLTSCTLPLLAFLSPGDHLLTADSVYGPTRAFCNGMLKRMGVETEFYDPLIGGGIRDLIRDNTKVIFTESPGSWTFEVQDIPAICDEARRRGVTVMMDNTWASPLYFKPFEHGVNIAIQAATKYIAGHSDLIMGSVTCDEESYQTFNRAQAELGICPGPDDVYLAARGFRTIATRLPQHWQSGLRLAEWLMERPEVVEVIHPALPHDPGYFLWRRDFEGSAGLFAFTLDPALSSKEHLAALLNELKLFGMGFSWGGYESLLIPVDPPSLRSATNWPGHGRKAGQVLRMHAGLEDVGDLLTDLEAGFERLNAVSAAPATGWMAPHRWE